MKIKLLIAGIFFLMAFALPERKNIKIFMAGDSTMSIKETKAFPETGWGMPFAYFWDSTVTIVNKAKNGRSTRSFMEEGIWKSITDEAGKGDYVLIQFGHNDEVQPKKPIPLKQSLKIILSNMSVIQEARKLFLFY